jgi:hypothetical protein
MCLAGDVLTLPKRDERYEASRASRGIWIALVNKPAPPAIIFRLGGVVVQDAGTFAGLNLLALQRFSPQHTHENVPSISS